MASSLPWEELPMNDKALQKERTKLGNQLQSVKDTNSDEASALIDKIQGLNLRLGKHPANKKKLSPTFTKTY